MTVIHIGSEEGLTSEFAKAGNEKLVVIDFTATWCGPCKMISPIFENLSDKYRGVSFLKVDVDVCQEVAMKYQVSAMPTFVYFKNGKEIDRLQGADPSSLENKIKKHGGPNSQQAAGFQGSGQRLGLNANSTDESSGSGLGSWIGGWFGGSNNGNPTGSSADNNSQVANEELAAASLNTDLNLPTTKLQVRLVDGTKLNVKVNLTMPVSKIREFICIARPDHASRPFALNTTTSFPAKEIEDETISINDAGLANSVLVQMPKVN